MSGGRWPAIGIPWSGGGSTEISDNFSTTANWTNIVGTLSVSSNKGYGSAWVKTVASHNTALSSVDHWAEATVSHIAGTDGGGLIVRASVSGYYACYFDSTTAMRIARHDGAWSEVVTGTFPTGTPQTIRLEVTGTGSTVTLKLYQNGSLIHTASDAGASRIVSGTLVGVYIDRDTSNNNEYVEGFTADAV